MGMMPTDTRSTRTSRRRTRLNLCETRVNVRGLSISVLHPAKRPEEQLPKVIFLPGITATNELWLELLDDSIFKQYDWVSASLPLHYPSTREKSFSFTDISHQLFADVVKAIIDERFGDEPVHLVGWSTGAYASLACAEHYPSQVKSVFSLCGFRNGTWHGVMGLQQRVASLGIPGRPFFRILLGIIKRFNSAFIQLSFEMMNGRGKSAEQQTLLDLMREQSAQQNPNEMARLFAAIRCLPLLSLKRVECPVMVAYADEDRCILPSEAHSIEAELSHAERFEIKNCGHLFFIDALPQVTQRMTDWISSHV